MATLSGACCQLCHAMNEQEEDEGDKYGLSDWTIIKWATHLPLVKHVSSLFMLTSLARSPLPAPPCPRHALLPVVCHLSEHAQAVNAIAVSQTTALFATCSDDSFVKLWDGRAILSDTGAAMRAPLTFSPEARSCAHRAARVKSSPFTKPNCRQLWVSRQQRKRRIRHTDWAPR